MSISVVIPSRNANNLEVCVAGKLSMEPGPMRLVVVDDGLPRIPDVCRGATILYGRKPFIFARNSNMGIADALEDAGCEGVVLLNDDAILKSPGGFSLLAKAARGNPEFGVIGAVTNVTGQPLQMPHKIGLRYVPSIAFVCVYIPRRTFTAIGLLDERFTAYGWEDNDYCHRVSLAGLSVGVHDGCYVDHGSLRSTFRGNPAHMADIEPGRKIFEAKWNPA